MAQEWTNILLLFPHSWQCNDQKSKCASHKTCLAAPRGLYKTGQVIMRNTQSRRKTVAERSRLNRVVIEQMKPAHIRGPRFLYSPGPEEWFLCLNDCSNPGSRGKIVPEVSYPSCLLEPRAVVRRGSCYKRYRDGPRAESAIQ